MQIRLESILVELVDFEAGVADLARFFGAAATRSDPAAAGGQGPRVRFLLSDVALDCRASMAPPREGVYGLRIAYRAEERAPGWPARPLSRGCVPIELVEEGGGENDVSAKVASSRRPTSPAFALDHVVIATAEPERVGRDLAETLGIRLALDRRFPDRGLRLQFFRLGGITLEVASRIEPAAPAAPVDAAELESVAADAFHGLAWRVASLEAERVRLERAGFDLSAIRPGHKPGTRVATVRAPVHGIPTLLIEHPPR